MAGGETLQPAASKEGFRALRVSVDLEIAKGLTDLFPTLEDPGALVSNACALQLEADEVTTDFGSPLPFVVFVRSDGSSNPPSNISVEPIPGRHRYRLRITLDDKHLRTTVFGAAQIGKATIISQGSLKPQPYITLGEQERREGVLLLAQDPNFPHSIYMGQLENMPNDWTSVLRNRADVAQQADGRTQSDTTAPVDSDVVASDISEVRRAELLDNVQRDIADGLRRLYPVLDEWPRSMESLKRARRACIVPLQFDGVSTDDFTVFAPFVAVVRSDGGSNPTSVSVEPDPTGSCQYRLRIPSDLGEDNLTSTPFNLSSGGEYLYIAQGAFGFWTERQIPLADQGGYSKSERLLLCAQDPDNPELISIEQVLTTKDWRSVFEAGAEKTEATRVDGDDVVVPEAESRSIRDQVLERIMEALSELDISYPGLQSSEDLINRVFKLQVTTTPTVKEEFGELPDIVIVEPNMLWGKTPQKAAVSVGGFSSDSERWLDVKIFSGDDYDTNYIGDTLVFVEEITLGQSATNVLLLVQEAKNTLGFKVISKEFPVGWQAAFEDGRMIEDGEDQDRLESVELPKSSYTETVLLEVSASNSGEGATSSLETSGDVFPGQHAHSGDSRSAPSKLSPLSYRESPYGEEPRQYIGATPVVSKEDSLFLSGGYEKRGGEWVFVTAEQLQREKKEERIRKRARRRSYSSGWVGGGIPANSGGITTNTERRNEPKSSRERKAQRKAKLGAQRRPSK